MASRSAVGGVPLGHFHRRRGTACGCSRGLAALAFAGVLACDLASSPSGFSDVGDCDWTITSDTADGSSQTKGEVEDELVRELAIKLRQFDRCIDQTPSGPSSSNEHSAAGMYGATGTAVAHMESTGQNSQNRRTLGKAGDTGTNAEVTPTQASDRGTTDKHRSHSVSMSTPSAVETAMREDSSNPDRTKRIPRDVVEDDVARILREAAEQETDPTRRTALWAEYENYVKNL